MIKIKCTLKWKMDPRVTYPAIESGLKNKVLRIALNAAAAPAKQAVIDQAPSQLGLLRRAMRVKIKHYRSGECWVAVIGATSAFKRAAKGVDRRTGRSKILRDRDGNKKWIQPARYQYPQDQGGKKNSAREFIQAAYLQSRHQFVQIASFKIREQLDQLMRQAAR